MNPRFTRALGSLALLVASTALALCGLEAAVRMFAPQESAFAGRGLFRADPELGHVLRPGSSADVHINSWGMRGREVGLAKPAGTFRVLGLGDSFTFGRRSPDEVYLELVEQRANAGEAAPRVEVLNAGVPGYDSHQETAWLRKFGLRFSPDLVVLGLLVTGDVIENASGTLYEVVDGELTTTEVGRLERLLRRSHLYRLVRRRLTVHAAEPPPRTFDHGRYLDVEWSRVQVCRRVPDRLSRRGFRATESVLLELRDLLKARHIGLLVLLIPDEVQVDPRVMRELAASRGARPEDFDLDLPSRRLREFLEGAAVEVIDLLGDFRERQQREPVYLPEDTHWNAAGNDLAAQRVAERIRARLRSQAGD